MDNKLPTFMMILPVAFLQSMSVFTAQNTGAKNRIAFGMVGRAADDVLRDYKNVISIFVYAPEEYKIRLFGQFQIHCRQHGGTESVDQEGVPFSNAGMGASIWR